MIHAASLPLFLSGTLSLLVAAFYGYLAHRLKNHHLDRPVYGFFALLSLVNFLMNLSFGILLAGFREPAILSLANRVTVACSTMIPIMAGHLLLDYAQKKPPYLLGVFYTSSGILALLSFIPWEGFLGTQIIPKSSWYSGLAMGPLGLVWAANLLASTLAVGALVFRVHITSPSGERSLRRTLKMLLFSVILWGCLGLTDMLTSLRVVDLPPLSWSGYQLFTLCFAFILVLEVEKVFLSNIRLSREVSKDHLTGVGSRSYFEIRIRELFGALERKKQPVYLGILDIDNFKRINDNYGHPVGDQALMVLAATVKASLRPTDLVARMGGDEFVILLEGIGSEEDFSTVTGRIMAGIRGIKLTTAYGEIQYTCSLGFTRFTKEILSLPDPRKAALETADLALYESKNAGKNQVFLKPWIPA